MSKSGLRKVTVTVPEELIEIAKDITGLGVESTLRLGLAVMATHPALGSLKRLQIQMKLRDLAERRKIFLRPVEV